MTKRALLIGINYIGTQNELSGCINDSINLKQFLINYCNYEEKNIVHMTDLTTVKPTRENIQKAFEKLIGEAKAGDTLFFSNSSHGSQVQDTNNDEIDKQDEVLVPLDFMTKGVISDDYLNSILNKLVAGVKMTCVFDNCHSGSILDLKYNLISNNKYLKGTLNSNIKYNTGEWSNEFKFLIEPANTHLKSNIICFSGCRDDQTSADVSSNSKSFGAFTKTFIDYLNNNIVTISNKKVLNDKLKLREICKGVNANLQINGYSQQSILSFVNNGDYENFLTL
jgi:hypothetical protein